MRVALDARHAARGLGIANFVTQLARELVAVDDIELIWLGDPALAPAGTGQAVPVDRLPYPALDGPLGRALARRLAADVIHFTGNTGWGRRGPVPSVLTVQDLIFLDSHGGGRSGRQVLGHAYERRLIPRAIHAADAVAVSSETIATEVRTRFGRDLAPHVIPYGVDRTPVTARATNAGAPTTTAPYLIAFAGRDPRKRTADVVAAWRALSADGSTPPLRLRLLASAGLPPGLAIALAPDVAVGAVEILEHVTRARIWAELAGATALVYPSAHEGFGLPVLEGMAAGTPVLSGLAAATREVGGDALVTLDPADVPGSIAASVRRLRDDPAERARVIEAGRRRAASFSWQRTAAAYLELYRAGVAHRR
jgi:glycosyltransferase involved in cell wall biosynthesis